jgi:hypothetical protein
MDFKPNEFFIGLVEFITILLPGAVLALIILLVEANHPMKISHPLYQYVLCDKTEVIFWVAFVFSSFGLGYFLSSTASGLDYFYDRIRKQYYPHIEDLSEGFKYNCLSNKKKKEYLEMYKKNLVARKNKDFLAEVTFSTLTEKEKIFEGYIIKYSNNYLRIFLSIIFNLDYKIKIDRSYEEVRKILNTQPESVRNATNAYKWAGTVLETNYPAISEQTTRIMSASKFFRSIVLVSLLFLALQVFRQIPSSFWAINLLILALSFREYIVQRHKSVQKTYQSIVTLTNFKKENSEINQNNI